MTQLARIRPAFLTGAVILSVVSMTSCRSPGDFRRGADRTAYDIITQKQQQALGRTEPISIETPAETLRRRLLLDQHLPRSSPVSLGGKDLEPIERWPDDEYLARPDDEAWFGQDWDTAGGLNLTLIDALQVGAHENRDYQSEKERVFEAALQLDLERDEFRNTWAGTLESLFQVDPRTEIVIDTRGNTAPKTVSGVEYGGGLELSRRFVDGLTFTGMVGLDLVSLLTQDRLFSRGVFADVSISIPLMRGSGKFVVTEPLTQAERDIVYAIYEFERFKREFAVNVASEYLSVLRQLDAVQNADENYRRLIRSTRRARRLADAGRLPEIQVDQSRQDELRARNQWVSARQSYHRQLDGFKLRLGLPVDARIGLDRTELDHLTTAMAGLLSTNDSAEAEEPAPEADAPVELVEPGQGEAGRYELDESEAVLTALDHRLDMRVAVGQVHDAQRAIVVAADRLRADITLLGGGSTGGGSTLDTVDQGNVNLRPDEGLYSALLTIDLPLERTAERNAYRVTLIRLEQVVRHVQALEDQVKLEVRNGLSRLLEARESIQIQAKAVTVARRRVASTNLFLEAGRAEIRDVLEAQEALVTAQNALTAALVQYRVNELGLQRDLGVLEVNQQGLWHEYVP